MPTEDAILRIAVAAALADGTCGEGERARFEGIARALGVEGVTAAPGAGALPADLRDLFPTPGARREAYELAVSVCNADGAVNDAEARFLAELRARLGLGDAGVSPVERDAGVLASAPVAGGPATPGPEAASADDTILQHAMLAAALELLPQSLATMAVIPVQLRLVYLIGQAEGQQLDGAQAKDLLAALGIGAAAQVVDGAVRKLLGTLARGLLGRVVGGVTGGVAGAAAGAATAFASTYALGHVATRYYAQGRRLDAADLRALFARLVEEAKTVYPRVRARVEEQARGLDLQQVIASLGRA
jgi:uncharacterized protein (DUF697 family)